MRRTKIVCTMGPSTMAKGVLGKMIKAGMNVARFNFSHGDHAEHKERIDLVKKLRSEMDTPVALMLDTKGPEIRIRTFETGKVQLHDNDYFTLTTEQVEGNNARVSISYTDLPNYVKSGDTILVNDGMIELCVDSVGKNEIVTRVVHGGSLSNRKSINIPGIDINMPYLSQNDKADIKFGIEQDVDYIALSFVRTAEDVLAVKEYLQQIGGTQVKLISKIENRKGVDNIAKILEVSDGIMVARGDMGVEINFEELPSIQKELIKNCYEAGKIAITATQMLESMTNSPRPTRAETSDVANAVFDGTSATMLSGETAAGKYPVETVRTMAKIVEHAEKSVDYARQFDEKVIKYKDISDAISHATCSGANDLKAKAIIVTTQTGSTARKISRFRPYAPIIAATTSEKIYQQLSLNWGVVPTKAVMQKNSDMLFSHAIETALGTGLVKKGDLVALTAGVPVGVYCGTNILKMEIVQ